MSSEKTQYYSLHRWRPEDAFLRAEFNENSELVDSALHGIRQEAATGVSGVQAAVEEARRAAEEAVEGARSEALAAVSGAKNELTEALNKAKADLNAAVAAAKKEAAAAVEEAKSEAEQAAAAAKREALAAMPLVLLKQAVPAPVNGIWDWSLADLDLTPYYALRLYMKLNSDLGRAILYCNNSTRGYSYVSGSSTYSSSYLFSFPVCHSGEREAVAEIMLLLGEHTLTARLDGTGYDWETEKALGVSTISSGIALDQLPGKRLTSLTFCGIHGSGGIGSLASGGLAYLYGLRKP